MKSTISDRHVAPPRGIATVGVTMILALLTALAMIYLSRNALFEQRMAANDQRERQAMGAASAGLDRALAFMDGGGDVRTAGAPGAPTTLTAGSYRVAYCSGAIDVDAIGCAATPTVPVCGGAPAIDSGRVTAIACGWSDDNTAVRKMSQVFALSPSLPNSLETPLVSRGAVNIGGGTVTVLNYDNDLTVWTGAVPALGGGNPETYIKDKAATGDAPDLRGTNPPSTCSGIDKYVCSSTGASMGHDVIAGDTRLSTKTEDQFFEMFFDTSPDSYLNTVTNYKVDLDGGLAEQDSTNINDLANLTSKKVIWVSSKDSPVTLSGMTVGGPGGNATNKEPMILIVDGDLQLGAGLEFNGLIFVRGDILPPQGSPKIFGSLISSGSATVNTGNLMIVFDGKVIDQLNDAGKVSRVPGSWRDW